jgi:hypothetical protein
MTLYRYVATFPVREGQAPAISAGFYPKILALFLGVLAVIQIGTAIIAEVRFARSVSDAGADTESGTRPAAMPAVWKDRKSLGLFLFTVVALVIYPFVLRLLGFTITGLLFLGSLIVALSAERRRGKDLVVIIVVTIGIGILTYFVFRRFLQIPFPAGIFGR